MCQQLRMVAAVGAFLATTASVAADTVPAGRAVFDRICAACHQPNGVGMPGLAPPLAGTLAYAGSEAGKRYLAGVLTQGLSGQIVSDGQSFTGAMPSQQALTDFDLADAANFVATDLNGITTLPFSPSDFAKARDAKPSHKELRALRGTLLK